VKPLRAITRQRLDERFDGLAERVGPHPARGWVNAVRVALGMSTYELGRRMGITHSRVCQLELGEVEGSIRLSTLRRTAEALDCRLVHVLVPNEPLEQMVHRQALRKAASVLAAASPPIPGAGDQIGGASEQSDRLAAMTYDLIDRRGLWS
jgi:predicted DNA-binding mobile mystery protein A